MELILLSIFVVVVFWCFYYIFNNGFSACNKLKTKLSHRNYKNGNDSKNKNNSKTSKSNTQCENAVLPAYLVKCYVIQEIKIGAYLCVYKVHPLK